MIWKCNDSTIISFLELGYWQRHRTAELGYWQRRHRESTCAAVSNPVLWSIWSWLTPQCTCWVIRTVLNICCCCCCFFKGAWQYQIECHQTWGWMSQHTRSPCWYRAWSKLPCRDTVTILNSCYCPLHAPVSRWNWVSLMPNTQWKPPLYS